MDKELLNEAERFLLKNWEEARLLEVSMEEVRTKYKGIFQKIIDTVAEKHPQLDTAVAYPTQMWEGGGSVGFGRKSWPDGGDSRWPPGFWISSLRLESLSSGDSDDPYGHIYVSPRSLKQCRLDVSWARDRVLAYAKDLAATQVLTADEVAGIEKGEEGYNTIIAYFPSPSKKVLLNALAEGDGQQFVEKIVSVIDLMARFIPAMDEIFKEAATPKR